jgi:hypothetical protein
VSEPSNGELLTHIQYIKTAVDATAKNVEDLKKGHVDHEARVIRLEERSNRTAGVLGAVGGLLGGFVSGMMGGKVTGA